MSGFDERRSVVRRPLRGWGRGASVWDGAARLAWLVFLLPLGFLAIFFFYPLSAILGVSFRDGGAGALATLSDQYELGVIGFSAWQAALSTALTLAAALPAAWVFARFEFPGKPWLRAIATAPFVLPTVVVAAAFGALLGPRGLLNAALQGLLGLERPPIQASQTLGLVLLAHVFYNYAVVLRIVGGFWSTLDPALEEAAASLGAGRLRVLRVVTLPLLLPSIGAAALLVFIFTFSSFGIVLLLGGPRFATVEVEIYRLTAQALRLDAAAALALVQMAVTLASTLLYTRLLGRAVPLEQRPAAARRPPGWRERLLIGATIALLLLLVGAPLLALALRSVSELGPDGGLTLAYYRLLSVNRTGSAFFVAPLRAIGNSLLFALMTTGLALLVGVPAAYLLHRGQRSGAKAQETQTERGVETEGPGTALDGGRRTKDEEHRAKDQRRWAADDGWRRTLHSALSTPCSALSALLDPLFMLPLGTSAVTLGLGYLLAFGQPPLRLIESPLLIPAAHTLLAFPFVVRSLLPALAALDPRLREAAAGLGAGPLRIALLVDLPLLAPSLLAGAIFAFTVSLGDFGAALLLARPQYPTAPLVIARLLGQPGAANYGQALALSTLLMLVATAAFVLLERARPRGAGGF
jgi:thiamine transport system permease protein